MFIYCRSVLAPRVLFIFPESELEFDDFYSDVSEFLCFFFDIFAAQSYFWEESGIFLI